MPSGIDNGVDTALNSHLEQLIDIFLLEENRVYNMLTIKRFT